MSAPDSQKPDPTFPQDMQTLKILSYNVHSCRGTDGKLAPERIAEVISQLQPDIIGLQELDVGRQRSGGIDQAHVIAELVKMNAHFHPAMFVEEEKYGDAILTALPVRQIKAGELPSFGEPRGALWVEIAFGGKMLQVFNTHLGLRRRDRLRQVETLLGPEWLGNPEAQNKPRIMIGDFNSIPSSRPYRHMAETMREVHAERGDGKKATFPSRFPLLRLDHVFVSGDLTIRDARVVSSPLIRLASDHLPVLTTIGV
jgi:endonuclease/exonuclease/phosphatase family metal-dependent hydrolase